MRFVALFVLMGCPGPGDEQFPLATPEGWQFVSEADDPLADHRPDPVDCPVNATYPEADGLEVDTSFCNYLAMDQPSLHEVNAGDTIAMVLWHQDLVAAEPAESHVAIGLGDEVVWEAVEPIPTGAKMHDVTVASPADFPEGTRVFLHLHNHGNNSWNIATVAVDPE